MNTQRPKAQQASLKQRMYLYNLHEKLGWDLKDIRNLSKFEASEKIEKARDALLYGAANAEA